MADEKSGNGSGSNDRATVALVAEKVDGLKELTARGFVDLQRQLDAVAALPEKVTELATKHHALSGRVVRLEQENERRVEWHRGPLLSSCLSGCAIGLTLYLNLH